MEDAAWLKRWLFRYFMGVARAGRRPRSSTASRYRCSIGCATRSATLLVYGPLKNTLGLQPRPPRLYRRRGDRPRYLRLLPLARHQHEAALRHDRGLGLRLHPARRRGPSRTRSARRSTTSRSRSPRMARCCTAAPASSPATTRTREATAETKRPDGWVHTGDAGFFDEDGQLTHHRPRQGCRAVCNDGTLFAPKYIENKLKFFPYIKEAVAFGADRPFRRRLHQHRSARRSATGPNGAASPMAAIRSWRRTTRSTSCIAGMSSAVNRDLAAEPALAGSQIRRFLILHKELDADDGELTRTRKVRRAPHRRALPAAGRGALFGRGDGARSRPRSPSRTAARACAPSWRSARSDTSLPPAEALPRA